MSDLFISYSRTDKAFVERLNASLKADGREAWVDWEGIPISAQWMQEIYRGIDAANTFLFVISPPSVSSATCRLEIAHAVARQKRIVPILVRVVSSEELPRDLAEFQYISFADQTDYTAAFRMLIDALDMDLEWVREHTRLLLQAEEWNAHNRDPGYVLRGQALVTAETWLNQAGSRKQAPLPLHKQYIAASRQDAERQRRVLAGWIGAAVVVLLAAGIYAYERTQRARLESALKLTAQANVERFRYPGKAYATALQALEIDRGLKEAEVSRDAALHIIHQRVSLANQDRENWGKGSPFIPLAGPFFKGKLTARISSDGRYVTLATERGETGNDPPGDAYLFDNESLRATKLEPLERKDRIKRRLEYVGFGSSERKLYLARQFNVEIYDMQGRFTTEFYVSSTKYPISLVDGVDEDRLLVVGDSTGPVWIIDAATQRNVGMFFRYNTHNPLVNFALSPSGRTAILVLRNGEAHLWKVGEVPGSLPRLAHKGKVTLASFKPDRTEETWITAGDDGIVMLWTLSGEESRLISTFDHQREEIGYATFVNERAQLVTFTYPGTPRLWDLKSAGP
jgi:hypothetical protein